MTSPEDALVCGCGRGARRDYGLAAPRGCGAAGGGAAARPPDPAPPVFSAEEWDVFVSRTVLLVWLMLVQSISGFVLEQYAELVSRHPILTYCLTFLVGTGGNASAQTATIVVRALATGKVHRHNQLHILYREGLIGAAMGVALAACGFARVYFFFGQDLAASLAIAACLLLLCVCATLLATVLPLLLNRWGKDPAHASPIVAVCMDVLGVTFSCMVFTAAFSLSTLQ